MRSDGSRPWAMRLPALASVLLLGGCASFSPDGGFGTVQQVAYAELQKDTARIGDEAAAFSAREAVDKLLKRPLTAESAVQIALLNNRGLQAAYNELGLSEARFVQASLPPNPSVSLSQLAGGLELEIERQLIVNLLALATLPVRREIAAGRFQAAQLRAAEATLRLAADARKQFYRAVAANQKVGFLSAAKLSTQASSELAQKLGETGGLNKLDQAREHALTAETAAQLARARLEQRIERERLVRQLGLWGNDINFTLPAALPALPKAPKSARDVEMQALQRRIDLQIAKIELEALGKSLGLTQATRFVNDLELAGLSSYERTKTGHEKEKLNRRGLEITFEIPLFDFGQARVAEAEQSYMQAANLLAQKAVNIRSEAREAYQAYRGALDIARLYQIQILPLRQTIQEQSLLHYSGMLQDVSQLILDARSRILSNAQAIDATRDFWIANTDLHIALAGGGGGPGMASGSSAAVEASAGGAAH